jgi:hypothetical protein
MTVHARLGRPASSRRVWRACHAVAGIPACVGCQDDGIDASSSQVYCPPSSLGLIYDLTPPEFVTALVTEVGIIPPTSVPVIMREAKDKQSA